MSKVATKALYLFLCSILGMVLFTMLHRAIFVLYDIVLIYDFQTFSLGMSEGVILAIDFLTMMLALFFGGWYGVALGLEWYSMVYGANAEIKPGVFHGFLPHTWRGDKSKKSSTDSFMGMPKVNPPITTISPTTKSAPVVTKSAPAKTTSAKPQPTKSAPAATSTTVKVPIKSTADWSFDDFFKATPPAKKKAVAKKTTAKKTVRKTTTKE